MLAFAAADRSGRLHGARRRGMVGGGDSRDGGRVTKRRPGPAWPELLESSQKGRAHRLDAGAVIRNGRRSVVITGTTEQWPLRLYCTNSTEKEEGERKNKSAAVAVSGPVFQCGQVEVGFHTTRLARRRDGRPLGGKDRYSMPKNCA